MVRWDVWCDDGRYCNKAQGRGMLVPTKAEAIKMARALGWQIKTNHAARCPDCVAKKRSWP